MGSYLCQYGNHKINFNNRSHREIACEIKEKLDNLKFINEEYLRHLVISREEYSLNNKGKKPMHMYEDNINRYKNTMKWEWDYRIVEEKDFMNIEFRGFLDFELEFSNSSIYFKDPPYSQNYWFHHCDDVIKNEWRKYMYQVIKLFDGDRALYFGDQGNIEIYLDKFDQIPVISFDQIENEIIKEFGKNKNNNGKYSEGEYGCYLIDNFSDLELKNKLSIDEFIIKIKDKKKKQNNIYIEIDVSTILN